METSAHVSPLGNLAEPFLVICNDDGVDVKAKPVLPHMDTSLDHHAHSFSYETQLSESVSVSAISSLSLSLPAAHRPSRDALFSRSLTAYHFPLLPRDLMWFLRLFFLPDWLKSLLGQSRVSWKLLMLFLSLHAGPLVWTYHSVVLYCYTHSLTKWLNALYTVRYTHWEPCCFHKYSTGNLSWDHNYTCCICRHAYYIICIKLYFLYFLYS